MRDTLLALAAYEVLVAAAWLVSTPHPIASDARASIALAARDLVSAHAKSLETPAALVPASAPLPASLLTTARSAASRAAKRCVSRASLDGTTTAAGADATRAQSAKDVERDVFVINGRRVVGATAGYAAVEGEVARVLAAVLPCAEAGAAATAAASSDILHAANRTESGGDGFEAAQRVLGLHCSAGSGGGGGGDDVERDDALQHLLVADSRAAPPISISIVAGPIYGVGNDANAAACAADALAVSTFLSSSTDPSSSPVNVSLAALSGAFHWADGLRVGARVELRASTIYKLVTATTDEPQWVANVTAAWERDLGWIPSSIRGGVAPLFDINEGRVTVSLELTPKE